MAYDGWQYGSRVDQTTERKLYGKFVDSILNSRTLFARFAARGTPLLGKTFDINHKVSRTSQGQFFTGLENLNSAAWNTKITTSFGQTNYSHPIPSILTEAIANAGSTGTIDIDVANFEEAKMEVVQDFGNYIYAGNSSYGLLGLENIVDDGTNTGTIGGSSRTTYPQLNAYVLAFSGGTMTLARVASVFDGASAAGISSEEPGLGVTTKTVWGLFEQLIAPQMRNNYKVLPVMSSSTDVVDRQNISGTVGFSCVYFRGVPIIKDDACTSGVLYFLNEDQIEWKGRTIVPDEYKDVLKKVDLGTPKTFEGTGASKENMPSQFNGFFYTPSMLLPTQAGKIARLYVFGQLVPRSFRRHGKGTGITTV